MKRFALVALVAVAGFACRGLPYKVRSAQTLLECERSAYLKECGPAVHPADCQARVDALDELVGAVAAAQKAALRGADPKPAALRLSRAVERMLKAWSPSPGRPLEPCSSRSR